jgi:hypothetical protein
MVIEKYMDELISIRNRLTEIKNKSNQDVSNNLKSMDKLRFHHLCLAIGGLDSIILNLVKIR